MSARVEAFTRAFFWFGYAVFLSASIPHIAAYFRHFDPVTTNWITDIFYWTIAVLLAVVIDVSDVLVSIAVMKARANGAKIRDTFFYWFFIVFIMALSWFLNYQYNVVFGTNEFHAVDSQTIYGSITIGQVNPIVGSAFQLLLLVYTGMAHKFTQKPKVVDLKDLENQANEAEKRATFQARIDAVNQTQKSQKRHAFIASLKDLKEGVTGVIKGENNEGINEVSDEESETFDENITPSINPLKDEENESNNASKTDDINEESTDLNALNNSLLLVTKNYPRVASEWLSRNRKTASINEVMAVTGQPKKRLNKASFKRATRNPNLVLISSVIEWLKTAPIPSNNTCKTETEHLDTERLNGLLNGALKPRYNGHNDQLKETVNLDEYPELLV